MESSFRATIPEGTRLIETMGWHPEKGIGHLDLHLARLETSAQRLGFPYNEERIRAALPLKSQAALRVRLTLGAGGDVDVTTGPLPPNPQFWRVAVHPVRLWADDPWLGVKTTHRALYDQARAALPDGVDEWLFLNERGELCEGTITNLFVITESGARVTPPLRSGLLPGVLRAGLRREGWHEAVLTLGDLAKAREIFVGNALRGLIKVQDAPFA